MAKSISFNGGFRKDVRHSLGAFLGLLRPSLCFAVQEGPFCGGVSGGRRVGAAGSGAAGAGAKRI